MKKEKFILKAPPPYQGIFRAGDLIRNQNDEILVVISVDNESYKFIHCQEAEIKTVYGEIIKIRKGDIAEQPCRIVDKYYYLYEPR